MTTLQHLESGVCPKCSGRVSEPAKEIVKSLDQQTVVEETKWYCEPCETMFVHMKTALE